MNNEIKFANKIRQALNESARLDGASGARVAERLRAARERALARRRISAASEREPALAWARSTAAGVIGGFGGISGFSLRALLPTALLVAGLISIYSWQQAQRAADIEELDAQLLTDDLPIDAYLDRGFETWLKKVSSDSASDN
ncbi:MAG TPA: DUF3619 family protein [Burkholderiales bacterium]|nr:DUF3619 family protein [Burkholderiales bacterium]